MINNAYLFSQPSSIIFIKGINNSDRVCVCVCVYIYTSFIGNVNADFMTFKGIGYPPKIKCSENLLILRPSEM